MKYRLWAREGGGPDEKSGRAEEGWHVEARGEVVSLAGEIGCMAAGGAESGGLGVLMIVVATAVAMRLGSGHRDGGPDKAADATGMEDDMQPARGNHEGHQKHRAKGTAKKQVDMSIPSVHNVSKVRGFG
ncbi:MAG: hypothetical protein II951_02425 [Bacteroidales bacterium]|nr:hypothetical protein [Bacteroidales bacterium]